MYGLSFAGITIMGGVALRCCTHDGNSSKTEAIHVVAVKEEESALPDALYLFQCVPFALGQALNG